MNEQRQSSQSFISTSQSVSRSPTGHRSQSDSERQTHQSSHVVQRRLSLSNVTVDIEIHVMQFTIQLIRYDIMLHSLLFIEARDIDLVSVLELHLQLVHETLGTLFKDDTQFQASVILHGERRIATTHA